LRDITERKDVFLTELGVVIEAELGIHTMQSRLISGLTYDWEEEKIYHSTCPSVVSAIGLISI
jgi:hypothetical protein